jgi:hypothetical protein
MKGSAMSRRNEGSYRERNGIGSTLQSAPAHAATPERQDEIDAWRVKQELADTRVALNLARERAEDAEADLEEARFELDQFRGAPPIRPAPAPSAAPTESPAVTAIAAELVAVMAENDRRAVAAQTPAPAKRKRRVAKPKAAPASVPAS